MLSRLFMFCVVFSAFGPQSMRVASASQAVTAARPKCETGFAQVVAPVIGAVVNISTVTHAKRKKVAADSPRFPSGSPFEDLLREFFEGSPFGERARRSSKVVSLGSGFIINPAGYVVTNNHVVEGSDRITVILGSGEKLEAKVVGRDDVTDIALLKIAHPKPLPYIRWGDGKKVRVGDWVFAIGNPYGLGGTVTKGIISHIGRDIASRVGSSYIDGYFQTDAAINMGNSGGPLFDLDGKVIGINTVIYSPTGGNVGIGFSIPSYIAQPIVEQLKQSGRARRGWVGVALQAVDKEMAESLRLPTVCGAFVAQVIPHSPASKANIKPGDVILKVNGVNVESYKKLPRIIGSLPIGSIASLAIWHRNAKTGNCVEIPVKIRVEERQKEAIKKLESASKRVSENAAKELREVLGLSLKDLSSMGSASKELEKGVCVASVAQGSMAEEKGIRRGDLLIQVDQEAVNTVEEVAQKVRKASVGKRSSVLLVLKRGRLLYYVSLAIRKQSSQARRIPSKKTAARGRSPS